jgi:hypothetical protein
MMRKREFHGNGAILPSPKHLHDQASKFIQLLGVLSNIANTAAVLTERSKLSLTST